MKKILCIDIVDLRFAGKKELNQIFSIEACSLILYSKNNAKYVKKITNITNLHWLELPTYFSVETANKIYTKDSLKIINKPLNLVTNALISFTDDVTPELIDEKIANIYTLNFVKANEKIIEKLKTKVKLIKSSSTCFDNDCFIINNPNLITLYGKIVFNNHFLSRLPDKSQLNIIGDVDITDLNIDEQLFINKIVSLNIAGTNFIISKKNKSLIQKIHSKIFSSCFDEIENNTIYCGQEYYINANQIEKLNDKNLYGPALLIIEKDVTEKNINNWNGKILEMGNVYVPTNLKNAIEKHYDEKCKDSVLTITYNGKIILVTDYRYISKEELENTKEKYYICNTGNLEFANDISPELIQSKIETILNRGIISSQGKLIPMISNFTATASLDGKKIGQIIDKNMQDEYQCIYNNSYYKL